MNTAVGLVGLGPRIVLVHSGIGIVDMNADTNVDTTSGGNAPKPQGVKRGTTDCAHNFMCLAMNTWLRVYSMSDAARCCRAICDTAS